MADTPKSSADQVREIEKLVFDAEDKLDQVKRALASLSNRLDGDRKKSRAGGRGKTQAGGPG